MKPETKISSKSRKQRNSDAVDTNEAGTSSAVVKRSNPAKKIKTGLSSSDDQVCLVNQLLPDEVLLLYNNLVPRDTLKSCIFSRP